MKNLLFLFVMLLSLNSFSQKDAKDKTVLNKFILGYDSEKTLKEKCDITELSYHEFDGNVTKITLNEHIYKQRSVKVILLLVNDNLYGVRFYPKNDKMLVKYEEYLDTNFESKFTKQEWHNNYIQIDYEMDGNYDESFVHYDIALLKKYPQYKDF
jgi:hypothetical protein